MSSIDHVVLTRFNLPTPGPESIVRAQEGWLRRRIDLFERHTIPSMREQTTHDFHWIVYLDPDSPAWLTNRLRPYVDRNVFVPRYREVVTWHDAAADARAVTGARRDLLLTTNLDNDDAVAADFLARLHALASEHPRAALYLRSGLVKHADDLYLWSDPFNAFCSVSESWTAPQTAWRDWHNLLRDHFPVMSAPGPPGWLQVVHGQNVSNRVRGRRVDPALYRALFPGQLDGMPSPGAATLVRDRLLVVPARSAFAGSRRLAKDAYLRVFGKERLDLLKERLGRHGAL